MTIPTFESTDVASGAQDFHPNLVCAVSDGVARLTINRPDKRNALTLAMWRAIALALRSLDRRTDVRVIILTGAGEGFSAGADIAEFAAVRANEAQVLEYEHAVDGCCDAIETVSKPTIAAVNGFCFGGAVNVAMACDFRVSARNALYSIPAARLSIVYGIKGTRRLFNLVGIANAKRILFTAVKLDAEESLRIGLIDEVADDLETSATRLADVLARNAPLSITGAKTLLNNLASGEALLSQATIQGLVDQAAASADYAEGRNAFSEKRRPEFLGR